MAARIIVTGDKALDRRLRALGPKIANQVGRRALRDGAKEFKRAVEVNAPRGETGNLARSVLVRAGRRSNKRISVLVLLGDRAFKGPKWYATFPELGSRLQAAQGYMRRAFDTNWRRVQQFVLRAIRAGIP